MEDRGMIIEQRPPEGPSETWIILVGLGVGVGLALVGLAVLSFATQAGTALIIVAIGQAVASALYGVARVILAVGQAMASVYRARVEGLVGLRLVGGRDRARLGPRTREDIRELFD